MNLALNARDAMPDGGVLRVESDIVDLPKASDGPSGKCARIRVTDTGCGICAEDLQHIFEPFFTTKESEQGTGLGMSVVRSIVDRHGGTIDIESTEGEGTTITVHFPIALPDRRDHSKRGEDTEVGGSETVLLVEDNLHVQHVVTQLLLRAGYSALVASNGSEGLAVYEKNRGDIDVVLTDLVMPEMGGYQLMERIRETDPDIPVLFTSGYATPPDVAAAVKSGEVRLIQKPYRPTTLLRFIRATLDHASAAK